MYTGTSISLPTDQETSSLYVDTQGHQITPFNEDKFSVRVSAGQEHSAESGNSIHPSIRAKTPPPIHISSRQSGSVNSVLTMPIPGTKLAPEKFRGDFHKVKDFIQHYERLCIQNNVTLDRDKCETLLRYCSKREKQTIKNIPSYNTQVWSRLRDDILRLYDADLDTKRYKVKDVRAFSKRQKSGKIRDLAAWKKYCRKFLRIAGSLLNGGKISQKEYATYFWQGIPKNMKVRIENRILTQNPLRDLSEPYSVVDINAAAEAILQRDRFDTALDDSDTEDGWSSGEESDSEDSDDDDSSDSDSEDEKKRKRRKEKTSRRKSSDSVGKTENPKKRAVSGKRREVEGLIKQMNLLAQDDPKYGLAYYRAMKLDTDVSKIVGMPVQRQVYSPMQSRPNPAIFQQTVQPYNPPQLSQPTAPPSQAFPPRNLIPNRSQPPILPPPRGSEIICYGCGEKGHGLSSCVKIHDLLTKGLLAKDFAGRIVNKDGSPVRRMMGETFVQAIEREQRPQSHYITFQEKEDSERSESEGEDDDVVLAISGTDFNVFEVERPAKQIATKRKTVMEGVYPPRLKDLKDKENQGPAKNPDTGRKIRATKGQPSAVGVPREIRKKEKQGEPIPVDTDKPRYDGNDDDQIMEDAVQPGQKAISKRKEQPNRVSEDRTIEKRPPRKSAVSAHVNPFNVLDHVLNTKVELAVGEIIGVSRELSTLLADSIKIRTLPSAPVGLATSFRTKTRGLLIKLTMECDGVPIQAIIDTGSQLNIVSESVCNTKIRRPIDRNTSVSMNDANGGEGNLNGIVENVPLNCGGVMTHANLYVGDHVPFDLLLGRPWQRGNYVSIDERRDGTYLLFKDPKSLEARYEVLVTPDAMNPVDWDFDPSTWYAQEKVTSYFISTGELVIEADRNEKLRKDKPILEGSQNVDCSHSEKRLREITVLQNVLSDVVHKYTSKHYQINNQAGSIKEQSPLAEIPRIPNTLSSNQYIPNMEIQLVPARVQHDAELPSLFTAPPSVRTEAERLLMGHGDLTHFSNNQHIRHIIASSPSGIIIGHLPDQHGNQRTDMMLFNMGLISAVSPNAPNSSNPIEPLAGTDVQRGMGILHFYPNLGTNAPGDWEIPYFRPPNPVAVSSDEWPNQNDWADYDPFQVPAESAVDLPSSDNSLIHPSPRSRNHPFGFVADRDSDFEFDSDTSSQTSDGLSLDNEDLVVCPHCITPHTNSCPSSGHNTLVLNRVTSTGSVVSDISFPHSLPELESVSSSSDDDDDFAVARIIHRQERSTRRSQIDIMTEDRTRRLNSWATYEQNLELDKEEFRRKEMKKELDELMSEISRSPTPELIGLPSSSISSTDSSSPGTPTHPSDFPHVETPRLIQRQRILKNIIESADIDVDVNSAALFSPQEVLSINRAARFRDEKLGLDDRNNTPIRYLPPIEVYSVTIPSRPPTPDLRANIQLPREDFSTLLDVPRSPSPALQLPDSPGICDSPSIRPTVVYGADETYMSLLGEVQDRAAESLAPPVLYPEDRYPHSFNHALVTNPFIRLSDPPSPTDTEPVDHSIIPPRREFPPPNPQSILIEERRPLEVDMDYASQIPQYVQPQLDTRFAESSGVGYFKVNSYTRLGPLTDNSIPIRDRIYYPFADSKVHYIMPRVDRLASFDTAAMTFPAPSESLVASYTGRSQIFSLLAPRPPTYEPTFFPGQVLPHHCGPLDYPNVTATTIGERFVQLREARLAVIALHSRVEESLPRWLVEELKDNRFMLYVGRGNKLEKKYVDRGELFRNLHPVYNPLITDSEARFLRGVAYAYYRFRQDALGDAIDQLLRAPHYDFQLCRELLELGCLDDFRKEDLAYSFLEQYEDLAKGNNDEYMQGIN